MPLRIRKYDGKYGVSYRFMIIRNFRDPAKLYPRNQDHEVLDYLGTVRADKLTNPLEKMKVIQMVDRAADRLVLRKKLSERDARRVKEKVRERFPVPTAPATVKAIEISDETRRRVQEKYGALLKTEH